MKHKRHEIARAPAVQASLVGRRTRPGYLRWTALAAVLAAVFFISAFERPGPAGATEGCEDDTRGCAINGRVGAGTDAASSLAEAYAPVVYTKKQSAPCAEDGEAYFPAPVDVVLGNPDVVLKDGQGNVIANGPTADDIYRKPKDYYLDFPGDPRKAGCTYEEDFRNYAADVLPTVYAHLLVDQQRGQVALQYWLYFYFNDWNNKHESDWEFVQLTFDAPNVEQALAREPTSMVYAQHGGGETAKWTDDKVRKEDGHPVIYTPRGSHGSLYSSELALGKGEAGTGFGCDDATPPSQRFLPRVLVIPDTVTGPEDPFAWITYEGRWGEKVSGEFNGPTGPNTKRPWTDPLGWQEEQRDESVVVPEDAIGPNAAKAFCGVVAGGSKLLLQTGPYIVLVLLVGFVGATALTARRTQFRPVDVEPLRQRRRFGQIVGCSLGVLASNASLFLSIGALFVPIGIAVTAVQGFVVDHSPAEPVLDLVDEIAADGVVALALGSLGFGITYWLVLVGVIGALRDMDSGTSVSALSAFKRVWKQKWALLTARLRALAIIVLLSATIVGIPVAIWLAVRWTFLEHAILFDETSGKGARGVSARLVAGSWLRTLGFTIVVGYGAVALGPIVGMAVLLLTPAPVSIVNLISSMIYVTLVPYAAIAFTILYFDLKLAQSAAPTVFAPPSRAGSRTNARTEP